MKNDLVLLEKRYSSASGAIEFYGAIYKGERCLCIRHSVTGDCAVMDYNEEILEHIVDRIESGNWLYYNRAVKSCKFIFSNNFDGKGKRLTSFLYSEYNNLNPVDGEKIRVGLHDNSGIGDGILDLREVNIYDVFSVNKCEVIVNPYRPEEKYIIINVNGKLTVIDYDDDLLEILTSKGLCVLSVKPNGRHQVRVASGGKGYTLNLSRFLWIYYSHYQDYDNINDFINNIVKESEALSDKHIGHINALTWNDMIDNLCPMLGGTNIGMSNLVTHFVCEYSSFPIAYHGTNECILMELSGIFYKFNTPEDYENFQKCMLGKTGLTKSLQLYKHTAGNIVNIETPEQAYKNSSSVETELNREEIIKALLEWCEHRDRVLSMYEACPERFIEWRNTENGVPLTEFGGVLRQIIAPMLNAV